MEDFLAYIRTIHPIESAAKADIARVFQPLHLEKGTHFAVEGEVSNRIGFLLDGVMRAYYQNPAGQQYNKTFFQAPCFFAAFSSLISGRRNQIFIQALGPCEALVASYPELEALYDRFHSLERMARRLLEMIFAEKEQREIDLVTLDATTRYLQLRAAHPDLEQLIPQYHVASFLGVTPTQLSRIRADLAKKR